jgi:hypothetical protein
MCEIRSVSVTGIKVSLLLYPYVFDVLCETDMFINIILVDFRTFMLNGSATSAFLF